MRFVQQAQGIQQLLEYDKNDDHHLLRLKDTFIHRQHLCLAFELLSVNLTVNQMRFVQQAQGIQQLLGKYPDKGSAQSTELVKVSIARYLSGSFSNCSQPREPNHQGH
jgi:hypothetical protein